jgi:hypothetical protein
MSYTIGENVNYNNFVESNLMWYVKIFMYVSVSCNLAIPYVGTYIKKY